ncbi:prolipoprotein diacylglyceryl transferase family protein, partial [Rhizobium ruizarguesonis]
QLYEAGLEGIVLLVVLAALVYGMRALKSPGFITGVFVCGYALSRIFVEFFREPDAQLGYLLGTNWLTMGMVLSSPMILPFSKLQRSLAAGPPHRQFHQWRAVGPVDRRALG